MNKKEQIINIADNLLIEKGFNAFSYKDISKIIDIKTSSIHYHFPTKTDLGIAIIKKHLDTLEQTIIKTKDKTPLEKIEKLFIYYKRLCANQMVCIVGALTSGLNTLNEPLRIELLNFTKKLIDWVTSILNEGQDLLIFKTLTDSELRAKLLITNLMSLVQLSRIEYQNNSIDGIIEIILDDLLINNN